MAVFAIHAGHCPQGKGASGTVGILKESVEDRLVKDEVIRLLRARGHEAYDCTCDDNVNARQCLEIVVRKSNAIENADFVVSIHLNSARNDYAGDGDTGGDEVWNYDKRTEEISDRICQNISEALGIRNRGTKYTKDFYVLNQTNALAILVECCFVDDKDDVDRWDYKKCAEAIVNGLLNEKTEKVVGWNKDANGYWYLEEDGTYPTDKWKEIDGYWYRFNEDGYALQNRWFRSSYNYWYHFDNNCYMQTGWQKINGEWYYLTEEAGELPVGAMVTGWQKINGETYYFNPLSDGTKGKMATGWNYIDGEWYFFNQEKLGENYLVCSERPKGAVLKQHFLNWKDGNRYYLKEDGKMARNEEITIGEDVYKFNCHGWMQ